MDTEEEFLWYCQWLLFNPGGHVSWEDRVCNNNSELPAQKWFDLLKWPYDLTGALKENNKPHLIAKS